MSNSLRNGLIIGLVVSISLNLLLIGIGIGQRFHDRPPMMRMNPMLGLAHFTSGLPAERREALADSLHAFREAARPAFGELRTLQNTLREEIRRDPIDPVALRRALDTMQAHMLANQNAGAEAFVKLMQALTAEERVALDRSMHPGHYGRSERAPHPLAEDDPAMPSFPPPGLPMRPPGD